MPRANETLLEIDLGALKHNYDFLRSKVDAKTKFLAVVKAFAYGSDMVKIAKALEEFGVDYLAVAYVKEGEILRKAGIELPILVLHPQIINLESLINLQLEPSLYSPKIFKEFLRTADQLKQKAYPVHLKFNTGLNRLGFWENDINFIVEQLKGIEALKIKGVFSHLAASEDLSEKDFTQNQIKSFGKIASEIDEALGYSPLKHLLNTSGIINYPEAQWHMVRSGIGLYGYGNEKAIDAQLQPVATLKTIISQLHKIEPGESVGYNRAFVSDHYKVTATLPLGHADGIGRQYGNKKGAVLIHGKKAPIIGNVCMDMIMVDVTGIECAEGDEVVVFGKGHSAEAFAASANTISYELLTSISSRVKRLLIKD